MNNVTIKTEKGLVKKLRTIRDKMNADIENMSFEEVKQYLKRMREKNSPQQIAE